MGCEKSSEMEALEALSVLGEPMKQLKTVCKRHETSLWALHKNHFNDVKQRTFYGWSKEPEKIPPLILQRIASALKISMEDLIIEIWGEK